MMMLIKDNVPRGMQHFVPDVFLHEVNIYIYTVHSGYNEFERRQKKGISVYQDFVIKVLMIYACVAHLYLESSHVVQGFLLKQLATYVIALLL